MRRRRQPMTQGNGALQRAHRPDYQLILYVGLLMLLGLIIMYAIGPQRAHVLNESYGTDYTGTYFVIKQAASLGIAVAGFVALSSLPLSMLHKYAGKVLLVGLGLCAALFFFGNILKIEQIATATLGAYRWFNLGPLGTLQPAEVLKFGVLIYLARFLAQRVREGTVNRWHDSLLPVVIVTGVSMLFVIVLQKDMGTGISLLAIITSMLVVAGIHTKLLLKIGAVLLIVGAGLIVTSPHRLERVATFLRGDDTSSLQSDGDDYHIRHAKIAIGTGGLFGVGIGNSVQATGYLPEAINDSEFAIMGETFGFVGLTVIIILFAALLIRILKIADKSNDPWIRLMVTGVFGWIVAHVVLNIASMTGVFPLTGITLPLLSFGGTSMIFIAAAIGIVFQASRFTSHGISQGKEAVYANSYRGRRLRRTRYTSGRRTA